MDQRNSLRKLGLGIQLPNKSGGETDSHCRSEAFLGVLVDRAEHPVEQLKTTFGAGEQSRQFDFASEVQGVFGSDHHAKAEEALRCPKNVFERFAYVLFGPTHEVRLHVYGSIPNREPNGGDEFLVASYAHIPSINFGVAFDVRDDGVLAGNLACPLFQNRNSSIGKRFGATRTTRTTRTTRHSRRASEP